MFVLSKLLDAFYLNNKPLSYGHVINLLILIERRGWVLEQHIQYFSSITLKRLLTLALSNKRKRMNPEIREEADEKHKKGENGARGRNSSIEKFCETYELKVLRLFVRLDYYQ